MLALFWIFENYCECGQWLSIQQSRVTKAYSTVCISKLPPLQNRKHFLKVRFRNVFFDVLFIKGGLWKRTKKIVVIFLSLFFFKALLQQGHSFENCISHWILNLLPWVNHYINILWRCELRCNSIFLFSCSLQSWKKCNLFPVFVSGININNFTDCLRTVVLASSEGVAYGSLTL